MNARSVTAGTILEIRQYGKETTAQVKVVDPVYRAGDIETEFVGEFLPPHEWAGKNIALSYKNVVRVVE